LNTPESVSRRRLLRRIALAAALGPLITARARADELPLIPESDPAAKAVKYVEDGTKVKEAAGNRCDTCSLYQGRDGSAQGTCQIFKGKQVKAAGWCVSWAPQM
jgi:hypothetical protein